MPTERGQHLHSLAFRWGRDGRAEVHAIDYSSVAAGATKMEVLPREACLLERSLLGRVLLGLGAGVDAMISLKTWGASDCLVGQPGALRYAGVTFRCRGTGC
jgi:hypothetical protein